MFGWSHKSGYKYSTPTATISSVKHKMCLWFVYTCPECGLLMPVPAIQPQRCNSSTCFRKNIDPNRMNKYQKYHFLCDAPCDPDCSYEYCGLWIHTYYCSDHSQRGQCQALDPDSDTDGDSHNSDSNAHNESQ